MERDPARSEEPPATQDVLSALDDETCRSILSELTEPMTASELGETREIPQSTLYRKLDMLSRAALVREFVEVGPDGGRITRYERDVTDVTVSVEEEGEFSVSIDRPSRRANERLARLWATMGDEL